MKLLFSVPAPKPDNQSLVRWLRSDDDRTSQVLYRIDIAASGDQKGRMRLVHLLQGLGHARVLPLFFAVEMLAPLESAAAPSDQPEQQPTPLADPQHDEKPLIIPTQVTKKKAWKRHDGDLHGPALRAIGLRAHVGAIAPGASANGSEHPIGGSVVERGLGLFDFGILDVRYLDYLELGEDSKGLLYRADGQLSMGPRWDWTRNTGGVLRLGGRAHIARSGGLFTSDVRAPTISLGIRHESPKLHVDAVVEYAPVLAGYFEPPIGSYNLSETRSGAALLSVTWERFRLDAEFSRYWRDSEPRFVNDGRAWGCVYLGWGMVCADGKVVVIPNGEGERRITGGFFGLSVLVAQYEWLH